MTTHECYPEPYNPEDPLFFDTETCGFSGFVVLIQFKIGENGPVVLHHVGHNCGIDTLELIEFMVDHAGGWVVFNGTFDLFHLIKAYNCISMLSPEKQAEWVVDVLPDIEAIEIEATKKPWALKPRRMNDLMLFARSTALQMCMARKNLRVRRMPRELAYQVADHFNDTIELPGILFSNRKKNKSARFVAEEIKDEEDPDFMDVVLRFAPSTSLKAIAKELGITSSDRLMFDDVAIDPKYYPKEYEFAPFASVVEDEFYRWTRVYEKHCEHWVLPTPKAYAEADVHDTAGIYYYFLRYPEEYGVPEFDTVDNQLVAAVANTRYKGFSVDVKAITKLREKAMVILNSTKYAFGSPQVVKAYIQEVLDDAVEMILTDPHTGKISTRGDNLKALAKLNLPGPVCESCFGEGCEECVDGLVPIMETVEIDGKTVTRPKPHPAAIRAREVLDFRHMKKEVELYDKVLICGRIYPDVKIIGAKSSRMSGTGGFNFQGVKNSKAVRSAFTLKDPDENLQIGDLDAFEVSIMAAVYNDPGLIADLQSGFKIHGLFAQALFPDKTYEQIVATKDLPKEQDLYGMGKGSVFCMMYGGSDNKIAETANVDVQVATNAMHNFGDRYPQWKEEFLGTQKRHAMLVQKAGIGTKVEIVDPQEYAETLFGFKRYFDIDYLLIAELFKLTMSMPDSWKKMTGKVIRKDREQTITGATRTALYAAAFGLQSAIIRQAQNHKIQGSGSYVTKTIQAKIWELQPFGIKKLVVRCIQIHDEVISVSHPALKTKVADIVAQAVESFREKIPLIGMDWDPEAVSWADK